MIDGKSGVEIAEKTGLHPVTVSRIANAPATKLLMSELLKGHESKLKRLVGKSLGAIDDAFDARRQGCTKDGSVVEMGADHFARLAASKRLIEMVQAAREDTPAAGSAPGTITWEAFQGLRATLTPPSPAQIEAPKDEPDI